MAGNVSSNEFLGPASPRCHGRSSATTLLTLPADDREVENEVAAGDIVAGRELRTSLTVQAYALTGDEGCATAAERNSVDLLRVPARLCLAPPQTGWGGAQS